MKFFLPLVVLATVFNLTARATPEDDVVRGFYHWYVHALNQNENAEPMKSPQIHRYVTEHFLLQIAKREKQSGLDGGGLESDPFLMAQDWDKSWEHNIGIKDSHPTGAERAVQVVLSGKEMPPHRLNLVLVQEAGAWKIDQVSDGDKH